MAAQGGTKVYVGNLDDRTKKEDLEDVFSKFGRLADCWIARKPPGFAFVTFEDLRDAEDAVRELHGKDFFGRAITVEIARGRSGGGGGRGGGGSGRFSDRRDERRDDRGRGDDRRDDRRRSPPRRSRSPPRRDARDRSASPRR